MTLPSNAVGKPRPQHPLALIMAALTLSSQLQSQALDALIVNPRTEPDIPASQSVRIPDLFSGIMSSEVRVNPHYAEVKPYAEAWFQRVLKKSDNWAAKNSKIHMAYLGACWAPTADPDALILVIDWLHWVSGSNICPYSLIKRNLGLTLGTNRISGPGI